MSGGSDESSVGASIETRLALAAVLTHHAGELRRAGWEPVTETAPLAALGAPLWRRLDAERRVWHATLLVVRRRDTPPDATATYSALLRVQADQAR